MYSRDERVNTSPIIHRHHGNCTPETPWSTLSRKPGFVLLPCISLLRQANNKAWSGLTAAALLAGLPLFTFAAPMPPSFNLSALDGRTGIVARGVTADDRAGTSVSNAGDVNGDGVDDVIIGAPRAAPNGNIDAGESYVVFGGSGVGSTGSLELGSLDVSNGFVINGIDDVSTVTVLVM